MKNYSIRAIEEKLSVPKSTIHRYAKSINLSTNNNAGRPKSLSQGDTTFIVTQMASGKCKSAVDLCKTLSNEKGITVSPKTVSRELHKAGMKARTKKKKPAISSKNQKERLAFAKSHQHWTVEDWKRVIFSDETKINRFGSDGRVWSWYKDGAPLQRKDVKETTKNGGGHLMLWGCITSSGTGYLADIEGIMDSDMYLEILSKELVKTIDWYQMDAESLIFQHDNDPKHTAQKVKKYLSEQDYRTMVWPSQSPDLKPIENCWSRLKKQIYKYPTPATGMIELWERIETEWENMDKEYIQNLFESMPRRMKAVIKAKGLWTKY